MVGETLWSQAMATADIEPLLERPPRPIDWECESRGGGQHNVILLPKPDVLDDTSEKIPIIVKEREEQGKMPAQGAKTGS